jgi:hypothetical protein
MPFQCVICLEEDLSDENEVKLPCCGKKRSGGELGNIRYCSECILTLSNTDSQRNIRCPTCRQFLKINTEKTVVDDDQKRKSVVTATVRKDMGTCTLCRQVRSLIFPGCCHACHLGCTYFLQYECCTCHRKQRIPHPMWRYQPTPNEETTDTWACQQGCGEQAKWKIVPSEIPKIPLFDVPASWNIVNQADLIALMRENIQRRNTQKKQPDELPFYKRMMEILMPSMRTNNDAVFIYMIYFLILAKLISMLF